MKITEVTRRELFDTFTIYETSWYGDLDELRFLARIYDLTSLPSTDSRFNNAHGDIRQHCINNYDWDTDFVFVDPRFNLERGDDDLLLRFLAETVHPVVRRNIYESRTLVERFNSELINDGFELYVASYISGRPVYEGRCIGAATAPALDAVKLAFNGTDLVAVNAQIKRMEAAIADDPDLAIGTAKELIESCCKTILREREQPVSSKVEMPQLVKATVKTLKLTPEDIPDEAKASDLIKRTLSNLATVSDGINQLRGKYGTGHGRHGSARGLSSRHARLAVGAASTLALFLVETHKEQQGDRQSVK